jgi:hypothetical protein
MNNRFQLNARNVLTSCTVVSFYRKTASCAMVGTKPCLARPLEVKGSDQRALRGKSKKGYCPNYKHYFSVTTLCIVDAK